MTIGRVSVAMCTFNGAPYLDAQLESLARQRLAPDELVVCDDASTDRTVELLDAFAPDAPFPVRIYRNDQNLGSVRNFEQAMTRCRGELIALCDQDDVWHPDKLFESTGLLESHPSIGLACTDAEIVDSDLRPLGVRMSKRLGFGQADQSRVAAGEALEVLVRTNFVTGTATTFRAGFLPDILPIPDGWVHDGWIALVVALSSRLAFIDRPLLCYRQHGENQIGAPSRPGLPNLIAAGSQGGTGDAAEVTRWQAAVDRAAPLLGSRTGGARKLQLLRDKQRHVQARATLPGSRPARIPVVMREVLTGRYGRFSAGPASALKDLVKAAHPGP